MEELYIRFRDNTKRHIKERNLSIAKLETLSGIKAGSLRNIIYGASRNPSFFTVYKIAQALNMPVDQLIGGSDDLNTSMPHYEETLLISQIYGHLFKHKDEKQDLDLIFKLAKRVFEYCRSFKESKFDEDFCTYVINNPDSNP